MDLPTCPSTRHTDIWQSSIHSLGLAEKRYYVCRVKYVRIHKCAKFHGIWNGPTQKIVNFEPRYLEFQGMPSLAFAIFVISSVRYIISESFSENLGVRFIPWYITDETVINLTDIPTWPRYLTVFNSFVKTCREKILCLPC